ncbi:MAG: thermonuclease family protein [Clostridia bacterium]
MKFLKVLGWFSVPYLMLPFQWKKIGTVGKVLGSFWAALALITGIGGAVSDKKPAQSTAAAVSQSNTAEGAKTEALPASADSSTTHNHASANQAVPAETTSSQEDVASVSRFSAKVLEVIDGDTIKVDLNGTETPIRFLLVDTPETKHPQHGELPFGKEASNFTKGLLTGKTVELEQDGIPVPDKDGHMLYYAYVEGKSVQELLLEKGLARVVNTDHQNAKYMSLYRAIQEKAQKTGTGIWGVNNYVKEDGYHPEAVKKEVAVKKEAAPTPKPAPKPAPKAAPQPAKEVYYGSCKEAKAAGAAPLHRGEPGYRAKLDRDNDGVACE